MTSADEGTALTVPSGLRAEVERLEELLAVSGRGAKRLPRQLSIWAAMASEGWKFDQLLYEYVHNLGARRWLAEFLDASSWSLRGWLLPLVDGLDEEFRESTILDTDDLMWGSQRDTPGAWWARRIPNNEAFLDAVRLAAPRHQENKVKRRAKLTGHEDL